MKETDESHQFRVYSEGAARTSWESKLHCDMTELGRPKGSHRELRSPEESKIHYNNEAIWQLQDQRERLLNQLALVENQISGLRKANRILFERTNPLAPKLPLAE